MTNIDRYFLHDIYIMRMTLSVTSWSNFDKLGVALHFRDRFGAAITKA